jgi:hypothetical protein
MLRYSSIFILLLMACVDPFETKTEKLGDRVVVDGYITDLAPPYHVTLSMAANFSILLDGLPRYISNAQVKICDDLGHCDPLFEVTKGRYQTAANAMRGVVGRSYYVDILLPDAMHIQSKPELLKASPPITRAYAEWDAATVLQSGFQVYVDTDDPGQEANFYKYETESFYPYSGFCFTRVYERPVKNIRSDKLINGNTLSRVPVKVIPFSSTSTYVTQVYQIALSADAFTFYDLIRKQAETTGSIFDPPTSFLRGNMVNITQPDEPVLGYFYAGGTSRYDLVVNRSETRLTPRPFDAVVSDPLYCGVPCQFECSTFGGGTCGNRPCPPDCALLPGKTNIAPAAWPYPHRACE